MEKLLHFVQHEKNNSMEFVNKAKRFDGDIFLYGGGNHLLFAVKFMRKYGIPIKAILDSNRQGSYEGLPIIKFSDFLSDEPDRNNCWFVISAPSVASEIAQSLSQYFPKENIFSFEMEMFGDFVSDIQDYRAYLTNHWQEMMEFYNALADDRSRDTLVQVLKVRVSGDLSCFNMCGVPDQYYPDDIIRFGRDEVMVELGANDGKTTLDFLMRCPDYKAVYCFESEINLLSGLQKIQAQEAEKGKALYIIQKGAWDSSTTLKFFSEGGEAGNSRITDSEKEFAYTIETAAVDDAVKEPITYLKMDIEGAELRALHGARRQIRENRPALAVCVYHRMEDFLEIWGYLRELVPEYRFYLRHHNPYGWSETVMYAVI